ncbi:MAG: dTMP kinase [Rhodothermia bacterium]|nr:MAG: dTMP kinase [Rhodothermia bacterium]
MIISFEGIDGSGKSTQAQVLADYLASEGLTVHRVREPGGTVVSEHIRSILLDVKSDIDPFAEMLLYSAARAQLVRTKFRAFQEAGDVIICDRFYDSTVAYQGGGRRIADLDWLDQFQQEVTGGLLPDRTYLIRVSVETGMKRQEGRTADRMEGLKSGFFERVVKAYDDLAEKHSDRICVINGDQPVDLVAEDVKADLALLPAFLEGIG